MKLQPFRFSPIVLLCIELMHIEYRRIHSYLQCIAVPLKWTTSPGDCGTFMKPFDRKDLLRCEILPIGISLTQLKSCFQFYVISTTHRQILYKCCPVWWASHGNATLREQLTKVKLPGCIWALSPTLYLTWQHFLSCIYFPIPTSTSKICRKKSFLFVF